MLKTSLVIGIVFSILGHASAANSGTDYAESAKLHLEEFTFSVNKLADELLKILIKTRPTESFVFSPFLILDDFGILYYSTDDAQLKSQIGTMLGCDTPKKCKSLFETSIPVLDTWVDEEAKMGARFHFENGIWFHDDLKVDHDFLEASNKSQESSPLKIKHKTDFAISSFLELSTLWADLNHTLVDGHQFDVLPVRRSVRPNLQAQFLGIDLGDFVYQTIQSLNDSTDLRNGIITTNMDVISVLDRELQSANQLELLGNLKTIESNFDLSIMTVAQELGLPDLEQQPFRAISKETLMLKEFKHTATLTIRRKDQKDNSNSNMMHPNVFVIKHVTSDIPILVGQTFNSHLKLNVLHQ